MICSTTPSKTCVGKGVDADFGFLAELHTAELGFRDVDADVDLILLEQRGDRSVGRDQIAGANIEHFDGGVRGRDDLRFAEAGLLEGVGGFGEGDVFGAIAALHHGGGGGGLFVAGFGGGDFFGAVAALEFVEFVLGVFDLRDGHLRSGVGGVALLLRD